MKGTELLQENFSTILASGPSGSGKTSLIGKALRVDSMCPVYVFDFDLRLNSLLAVTPHDRLQFLSFDQYRDTASRPGSAFTSAEAKLRELTDSFTKDPKNAPKTVVLDSLTFCQLVVMNRVLVMDGKAATANPELQHYKSLKNTIEPFVSRLTALPCNVIVMVHDDIEKDEATGLSFVGIDMTGQLSTRLPGYFNELWHTEVVMERPTDPAKYKVRTRSSNVHRSRTCYPAYLDVIEDSDKIWQKLEQAHQDAKEGKLRLLV